MVRIDSADSCSSCAVSALCGKSRGHLLEVSVPEGMESVVGRRVRLAVSGSAWAWAVAVAFVVPVLLLCGVAGVMSAAQFEPLVVAASSVGGCAAWFWTLYLCRGALRRYFKLTVRK